MNTVLDVLGAVANASLAGVCLVADVVQGARYLAARALELCLRKT